MRALVAVLTLLAALKIYAQDQIYRSAVTDALVSAYRARAIAACRNDRTGQPRNVAAMLWTQPATVTLSVGKGELGINVWDVEHALWDRAYKTPYLVLEPADTLTQLTCTYDITSDTASIHHRASS